MAWGTQVHAQTEIRTDWDKASASISRGAAQAKASNNSRYTDALKSSLDSAAYQPRYPHAMGGSVYGTARVLHYISWRWHNAYDVGGGLCVCAYMRVCVCVCVCVRARARVCVTEHAHCVSVLVIEVTMIE